MKGNHNTSLCLHEIICAFFIVTDCHVLHVILGTGIKFSVQQDASLIMYDTQVRTIAICWRVKEQKGSRGFSKNAVTCIMVEIQRISG